jgi:hypothetical protein
MSVAFLLQGQATSTTEVHYYTAVGRETTVAQHVFCEVFPVNIIPPWLSIITYHVQDEKQAR